MGQNLLQLAGEKGYDYPVFFYGGKPEIVRLAAKKWQAELPNLNIVGIEDG